MDVEVSRPLLKDTAENGLDGTLCGHLSKNGVCFIPTMVLSDSDFSWFILILLDVSRTQYVPSIDNEMMTKVRRMMLLFWLRFSFHFFFVVLVFPSLDFDGK